MNVNVGNVTNSPVSAEAVAIGVGNRVVVNKHTVHNHGGGGERRKRNSSGDGDGIPPAVVIGITLTVLMATAWFFAQYADYFYGVLVVMGATQFVAVAPAIGLPAWYGVEIERPAETTGALLTAGLLAGLALYGWLSYPVEMTQIAAKAQGMKGFWCALNPYGEALSSQHALAAMALGMGNLLLVPQSVRSMTDVAGEPGTYLNAWASAVSSPKWLVCCALLGGAAWAFLDLAGGPLQHFVEATRMVVCRGQ